MDYRIKAEKLAFQIFTTCQEDEKAQYFSMLEEHHGKHSQSVIFWQKDEFVFDKIPKYQLNNLLRIITPFAPKSMQFSFFQYELLELCSTYHKKIEAKSQIDLGTAFDLYSSYIRFLAELDVFTSKWFLPTTYQIWDWQEVVIAVKYVQFIKMRASVVHFKKDLTTITQSLSKSAVTIDYELDFFKVLVKMPRVMSDLDRLCVFDNTPIPTFVGKYAEALNVYIFENLDESTNKLQEQAMYGDLLKNDLIIAVNHYRQTVYSHKKIDFAFKLQGGAGKLKVNIRTWATFWQQNFAEIGTFIDKNVLFSIISNINRKNKTADLDDFALNIIRHLHTHPHISDTSYQRELFFKKQYSNEKWEELQYHLTIKVKHSLLYSETENKEREAQITDVFWGYERLLNELDGKHANEGVYEQFMTKICLSYQHFSKFVLFIDAHLPNITKQLNLYVAFLDMEVTISDIKKYKDFNSSLLHLIHHRICLRLEKFNASTESLDLFTRYLDGLKNAPQILETSISWEDEELIIDLY